MATVTVYSTIPQYYDYDNAVAGNRVSWCEPGTYNVLTDRHPYYGIASAVDGVTPKGWINIHEDGIGLYVRDASGNIKRAIEVFVGTPSGVKRVTEAYVGTPNGNKRAT